MKKYVKPDLFYENFELSQSVANNCTQISRANHSSGGSCTYDAGIPIFQDGNGSCEAYWKEYEGYCYQSGAGINCFSS